MLWCATNRSPAPVLEVGKGGGGLLQDEDEVEEQGAEAQNGSKAATFLNMKVTNNAQPAARPILSSLVLLLMPSEGLPGVRLGGGTPSRENPLCAPTWR